MMTIVRSRLCRVLGTAVLVLAGCQKQVVQPVRPPPPSMVRSHQTLRADTMFAFGKAQLKAADNGELDALAERLKAAQQIESIDVIGYTDWIGDARFNQQLSARRAQTVSDYLVARGVPASLVHTEGRGSANALVECPHLKGARLLDCLAPNRRVDVDVAVIEAAPAAPVQGATTPAVPTGTPQDMTVTVASQKVSCDGNQCFRVRVGDDGPWKLWRGRIQGFDFVPGIEYVLAVRAYHAPVDPVDDSQNVASRYVYSNERGPFVIWVLDHVISQRPHAGG